MNCFTNDFLIFVIYGCFMHNVGEEEISAESVCPDHDPSRKGGYIRTIIKDAPFLTGHGFDSHGGYVIMCIEKSIGADRYQWLTKMLFSVSFKNSNSLFRLFTVFEFHLLIVSALCACIFFRISSSRAGSRFNFPS